MDPFLKCRKISDMSEKELKELLDNSKSRYEEKLKKKGKCSKPGGKPPKEMLLLVELYDIIFDFASKIDKAVNPRFTTRSIPSLRNLLFLAFCDLRCRGWGPAIYCNKDDEDKLLTPLLEERKRTLPEKVSNLASLIDNFVMLAHDIYETFNKEGFNKKKIEEKLEDLKESSGPIYAILWHYML
jgi:hypothetical protein